MRRTKRTLPAAHWRPASRQKGRDNVLKITPSGVVTEINDGSGKILDDPEGLAVAGAGVS